MERGTSARAGFARAAQGARELNGRQREVLDLLVAGRTNAEIAAALEMTFDGAKWNVAEILSKLGLESREEAADYWRWRNRTPRRITRALRGGARPLPGESLRERAWWPRQALGHLRCG